MKKLFNVLTLALIFISAHAQFSGAGSGTNSDPYQITNADELAEMAYFLGDSHKGTCFKLMNDIDLTEWIIENCPDYGWNPIGTSSSKRFKGIIDGGGHSIKGLYINRPDMDYVGLFGYIESATISNIVINESSITANKNVGSFAGNSYSSLIENCKYYGEIRGLSDNIGGIIGYAELPMTFSACAHYGTVSGNNNIGGIVGNLEGRRTTSENASVLSCCNYGDIQGLEKIGGIIGLSFLENHDTYTEFSGHYFHSVSNHAITINQCLSIGNVSGSNFVGGLLGSEESDNTGGKSHVDITDCYTKGAITGINSVGGIAGRKYIRGFINKCYSNISIKGSNNVGGIVGEIHSSSISSSCAIVTTLSASNNYGRICGNNKGSIVTRQSNFAFSNCRTEIDGLNTIMEDDDLNGTGISLDDFRNPDTYYEIGWNLTDIWRINNGISFPFIWWEKKVSQINLDKESINLYIGETESIVADVNPTNADFSEIDWFSSDDQIAVVQEGVVTAIAEGSVTINAVSKDGSAIQSSCTVYVRVNEEDSDSKDFENIVYMESFTADAGEQVELPILMKNNTADEIADFDFYLQLPNGIYALLDEEGYPIVTLSTERTTNRKHSVLGEIDDDGMIHVYSSSIRNTYFFSGTEGEVATITLKVADDAADGIYHIIMRNISMNRISGEDPYSVARFNLSAAVGDLSIVKSIADGESYSATENEHVDKLNYTRTFSSADKWQALYVPFSIPVDVLTENGLEVAELNNIHMYDTDGDKQFDKTTLEFLYLTDGETEANYPYLIKSANAGEVKLNLKDVELKAAAETQIECASTRKVFKIKGTYTGVSGADMFNNNYYAVGGGTLVKAASADNALKPQRWYMSIENKDGSPVDYYAPKMRIMINGMEIDEEETGIQDITTPTVEDVVYTLDGRKMNASALPSGIYVKNHQKMIVR